MSTLKKKYNRSNKLRQVKKPKKLREVVPVTVTKEQVEKMRSDADLAFNSASVRKAKAAWEASSQEVRVKNSVGTDILVIPTILSNSTLELALLTYMSNLFYDNVIGGAQNSNVQLTYPDMYQALAYLGEAVQEITKGGTQQLSKCPRIFDIITALCAQKTIKFGGSTVQYSPSWTGDIGISSVYDLPVGSKYLLADLNGTPDTYPLTPVNYSANISAYTNFLKVAESGTFGGTLVDFGSTKGLFQIDPSAYARCYPYFGSSGNDIGGLYSQSELEVPFTYPRFSFFVRYVDTDLVVSRIFHPNSGGIVSVVGETLYGHSNFSLLRNPIPPVYKFLDFYQIYQVVASWLLTMYDTTPPQLTGATNSNRPTTLPFSYTDFMLMLRQALLTMFPSQVSAQFVAPVASQPSQSNSVFQPFIMDSVTTPLAQSAQMILPAFIIENLNMLKPYYAYPKPTKNAKQYGTTPKKFEMSWIPVWGVYSGDTPPVYQFTDQLVDPVTYPPLFSTVNVIPPCNLWDFVSTNTPTVKINVNKYVPELINAWNEKVLGFGSNKSSLMSSIISDSRQGRVSLLPYTRVIVETPQTKTSYLGKFVNPADVNIINKPKGKESSLKNVKSKVDAIPPATYFQLLTKTILSHGEMAADYMSALRYFVIPMIRLDYTGGDKLTQTAYQVYTGEGCASSNSQGGVEADLEVYRNLMNGVLLSTGMFASSPTNTVLTQAIETISRKGSGIDLLGALVGGLGAIIPGIGGVVSALLS